METIFPEGVEVSLENKALWDKFNTLGTEMLITKAGRRMFPYLQVSVKGLHPDEIYMVILDITKVDDRRYKYNENDNQWHVVNSRVLFPTPVGMYVHPLCPCRGSALCGQLLTFNKAKLTNNPNTVSFGHILLESMGRYIPRLSIVAYHDYQNQRWENRVAFMFDETEFIAVTAYMNKEITKLKIYNNPFARAFRENGFRWNAIQGDSASRDAKGVEFERDQTSENSTKAERLTAITYFNNEGKNNDDNGIRVFHINPSSIIVTDVLPSIPSASSVMTSPNRPSSPTMLPTSETNVVFEPVTTTADRRVNTAHSSLYEKEKNGLDSLLYPRAPLQSITVEINRLVTKEKPGGSHVWATGSTGGDGDRDILCKVIDVRSIREEPLSSDEQDSKIRTKSFSNCGENMEWLSEENKKVNSGGKFEESKEGKTTKFLEYEENYLAKVGRVENRDKKAFDRGNDSHVEQMRNAEYCSVKGPFVHNSSESSRNAIGLLDTSKDGNISSSEEKVINKNLAKETEANNLISTSDESIAKGNVEGDDKEVEERKMGEEEGEEMDEVKEINMEGMDKTESLDSVNTSLEKVQEKQLDKEMSFMHEDNNKSQRTVDTKKDERESEANKEAPKPQISRLLHFVNSVPMPAFKFGNDKANCPPHNNHSVFQPSVELFKQSRLRKRARKRSNSLEQSNNAVTLGGQSDDSLKSVDQSDNRSNVASHLSDISKLMGQSEDPLKSVNHSHKRLKSVSHSCDILKPMGQSEDSSKPLDHSHKRLKSVTHSSDSLTPVVQSKPENNKTGKGIPTTVINVGYEEPLQSRLPYELPKLHQNSSTKCPEGKERGSALQGMNQRNSSEITRNEDPSCLGASNGTRQEVGDQNGAVVESASTEGFPVILNSYSIHPSNFSNRQSIDLNNVNETRVDAQNHKNRVAYPAENFYQDKNPNKEVPDRCSNKAEAAEYQRKKVRCSSPEGTNLHYRKIIPKPSSCGSQNTFSKNQEFIDLNNSMSSKMYQRQADGLDYSYLASKGVPLQVVYTFETKMSLRRAPDPRLPEEYNPTRTTFTGYASNLICSTPPIAVTNKGVLSPAQSAK